MKAAVTTKAAEVARLIEEQIARDKLAIGHRLGTKDELRNIFDVGLATINEAVKILQGRGWVTLKSGPTGGIFVATPDVGAQIGRSLLAVGNHASTIQDAIDVREHLESMVVSEAVQHRTADDVADLTAIVGDMKRRADDHQKVLEQILRLHSRIVAISPNETLRATYLGLVELIKVRVGEQPQPPAPAADYASNRIALHSALVEAIINQDSATASRVLRQHRMS